MVTWKDLLCISITGKGYLENYMATSILCLLHNWPPTISYSDSQLSDQLKLKHSPAYILLIFPFQMSTYPLFYRPLSSLSDFSPLYLNNIFFNMNCIVYVGFSSLTLSFYLAVPESCTFGVRVSVPIGSWFSRKGEGSELCAHFDSSFPIRCRSNFGGHCSSK